MRLVIADDHVLFRDSVKALLESRDHEVVGVASNGAEAAELARCLKPDVVLMDLEMPEIGGLAATRVIKAESEAVKVVVLTGSNDDQNLFQAIKSGAEGYLLKDLESDQFLSLLEGVGRGEPALTPILASKILKEFANPSRSSDESTDALTAREMDVLEMMVAGSTTNRELAQRLFVSENTIKFHVRNIFDKLHLHNRAQLVSYAVRQGLVEPDIER